MQCQRYPNRPTRSKCPRKKAAQPPSIFDHRSSIHPSRRSAYFKTFPLRRRCKSGCESGSNLGRSSECTGEIRSLINSSVKSTTCGCPVKSHEVTFKGISQRAREPTPTPMKKLMQNFQRKLASPGYASFVWLGDEMNHEVVAASSNLEPHEA